MRTLVAACALSLPILALGACPDVDEDYKKEKPVEEMAPADRPPPPPKRPKKNPAPADLGKCTTEVTGAIEGKGEQVGGKEATNVAYWYAPEERKNMMGVDGYVVHCKGEGYRFSLLPGGGTPDGMPFAPKKFTFAKGKSDGASVNVTFGQATLSDATGVVDVTAIDLRHIAGNFELAGKVVPGNKKVTIKGTFDYVCPGMAQCDFGDAQ